MKIIFLLICSIFTLNQSKSESIPPTTKDGHALIQGISNNRGFVENKGQILDQNHIFNPLIQYSLTMPGLNIGIRHNGFSYDAWTSSGLTTKNLIDQRNTKNQTPAQFNSVKYNFHRVDIDFIGANSKSSLTAEQQSENYLMYYTANTPENGLKVHHYSRLLCKELYPGIDLEYLVKKGNETTFEYNFILQPGADPTQIKMRYSGANHLALIKGQLKISLSQGTLTESIPKSWMQEDLQPVTVNYKIIEESDNSIIIGFTGNYNKRRTLIIDPTPNLNWCTLYGGAHQEGAFGISSDQQGNIFVVGTTFSAAGIHTSGAFQSNWNNWTDIFLAKFNSNGALQWGTYYGDSAEDFVHSVAVDKSGNIYFTGAVSYQSKGLASSGAHQTTNKGGGYEAILAKFNTNGSRLWGTYYGGNAEDIGNSVTTDDSGNVYMTGSTASYFVIATSGSFKYSGPDYTDAFLVKFDSSGNRLWGTYYGGYHNDWGKYVCVDKNGFVYIAGYTYSNSKIATSGAHQDTIGGSKDGFLVKFNSSGGRQWATYYGGYREDEGACVLADDSGNVFLTGITVSSYGIATPGAHQLYFASPALAINNDLFIVKFNGNGQRKWATYFGDYFNDLPESLSKDNSGNIYISGTTESITGIVTKGAFQSTNRGKIDGFLTKFNSDGEQQWGTYFGGKSYDYHCRLHVAADETIYLAGMTLSDSNIATAGAYKTQFIDSLSLWGDVYIASFKGCNSPVEINLKGNNVIIDDGNTITSYADSTDFGPVYSATTRSYKIENTGTDTLFISSVKFGGPNPSYFKASNVPPYVLPASNKTFQITFTPSDVGIMKALVQIMNSDCDEFAYSFNIKGGNKLAETLNFDGSTDYVSLPSNLPSYFSSGKISGEIWINSNSPTAYFPAILKNWGATTKGAFQLGLDASTGKANITIAQSDSTVISLTGTTVLSANKWYHVAFVADGKKLHLYLNGIEEANPIAYNGTLKTNFNRTNIGAKPGDNVPVSSTTPGLWNGEFDELRLWNISLTCDQIRSKMNHVLKGNENGLVAYYKFNQGATSGINGGITKLIDSSKNGLHGTLNTFKLSGTNSNFIDPGCIAKDFNYDPQTEIEIRGNNLSIEDEDLSPSYADSTLLGSTSSSITRTYTILNKGNDSLQINSIKLTGADAVYFMVTNINKKLAPSDSLKFLVRYNSLGAGTKTAIISVQNNDCDEGTYNFTVSGKGEEGASLSFDGDDDFVILPASLSSFFKAGFVSGEAWINSNNDIAVPATIIKNWGSTIAGTFQMGLEANTGHLKISIAQKDSVIKTVISTTKITKGTWFHTAFVADGSMLHLYINGIEEGTPIAYNGTLKTNFTRTNLGALPGNNTETSLLNPGFWKGKLDEIRLWNTARTCSQIKASYKHEININENGLVAYYKFNQGADAGNNKSILQIVDSSKNKLHGDLNYFILTGSISNFIQPGCGASDQNTDPQPEIIIKGNNLNIVDNDLSPSYSDSTDFGATKTSISRTFRIENIGTDTLKISSVALGGTNTGDFKLSGFPSIIAPSKNALINISFNPNDTGTYSASIIVKSNDCDASEYNFNITARKYSDPITEIYKTQNAIKNFIIFPNPVNEQLNINWSSETEKTVISIYSSDGKMIFNGVYTGSRALIDLRNVSAGIYTIELVANGVKKVVPLIIMH